jgi:outer membrane protein insertion porin family
VPEADLKRFIMFKPGMTYSRKLITATTDLMVARLGLDGYAFAKVDPVPTIDKDTHNVAITLMVDPGNRVYVRRINFNGATSVNDDVFRREMRQLEGSFLSNAAIERSKTRMQRLPFIEKAEEENKPVPGTSDLVDVDWKIKEGLPGTFSLGIGYSEAYAFSLNGSFTHSNWMGTGERVSAEANVSKYQKIASFAHTNPYTNIDGLSRTISLSFRKSSQPTSATSQIDTQAISLGLGYGYFITEYQTFNFGLAVQFNDLVTQPGGSAPETIDWVRQNGRPYINQYTLGMPPTTFDIYGTKYTAYVASVGWQYDSRNRTMFADHGALISAGLTGAVPGSDVEYWSSSLRYTQFIPLAWNFTYMFNGNFDYGQAYGNTTTLPPYNRWYAGGPDSVRGYKESRLGPRDYFGNPYGGNIRLTAQSEILFPMPEKWRNSARVSLFYDVANVFSNENIQYVGINRVTPVDYKFSYDNLKRSTGIAVQWLAPLGVFRFSFAIPLNSKDADGIHYQDEREGFQFTVGQAF